MEGIGNAPFPITTKHPEVQQWYDQANALLHSFWFEEAERTLRWCLKLEPENAMVYWGLARCGLNWFAIIDAVEDSSVQRYRDFLKEAVKRKGGLPERERLYIEAWDAAFAREKDERGSTIVRQLQEICLKYPDDVEAKVHLALFNIGQGSQLANEMIVREVLKSNPMHPGAHHVRIHNWDSVNDVQAIASCEQYGKAAPGIGHALHMPGHIYSKIGMWHEAAFAMDGATRIELRYLNDRLALPFETWNYSHNRNYLCYIQEQLGMVAVALKGARDLLSSPQDPISRVDDAHGEGITALCRALVKFERWDEILRPGYIPWREGDVEEKFRRAYVETLALLGKGQVPEARDRLSDMKELVSAASEKDKEPDENKQQWIRIVEGLLRNAEGKTLDAQRLLLEAMDNEAERRARGSYWNDPPNDPWPVARLVGDIYRYRAENKLAVEAYDRALLQEPNDAFTLAGLAASHTALGETAKATRYYGRLLHIWSSADPNLRLMGEAKALGLKSAPIAETPAKERRYSVNALDHLGPSNWIPYAAPKLDCVDADIKPVRLEDYRGRNVLLVFYLTEECVHCVEQLVSINDRAMELESQNTVVLAVSSAKPETNKASQALGGLKLKLLSDSGHQNARRFASYDDFEEMELHSTILIDAEGRVRWKRTGGDPFSDIEFLFREIGRANNGAK
jgi:peroxiredoxin